MTIKHIIILGGGPCGLSAAIALAKASTKAAPLRVTLLEIRPSLQTIGGTLNVTPLCLRYLDYLGVGDRLRARGISLDSGLDYISMRTGKRIGNIWGGIGGIRAVRHDLVESLLITATEDYSDHIQIRWGSRVTEISETQDAITATLSNGSKVAGDILLGADGLHSTVRRRYVDPSRQDAFTGRVIAMGWHEGGKEPKLSDGMPMLRDTVVVSTRTGVLLASYYEPTRTKTYFAHISYADEPSGDARDGWKLLGEDQIALKREVVECYADGQVAGLSDVVAECDSWHLWPVYILPGEGRWFRGRALLLGDAAHAMPPQGESTGLAIEDGVLLAHVFSRRETRTVEQLFTDFEALRKPVIDTHYNNATWAMEHGFGKRSWFGTIVFEWAVWVYLLLRRWGQEKHFAGDVRDLELPA
ncbi:hypothetical protein F5Y16DRAFT_370263 [Xylariaceae sp. FL0255]|nr:hypothetical protein F5Y16DRAFT_370263 [Xylariaceae sp. FL0255]